MGAFTRLQQDRFDLPNHSLIYLILKENSGVTMKRVINLSLVALLVFMLSACGGSRETGDLTGVMNRPVWKGINPYGMVYVPSGTLMIGTGDQDVIETQ